MSTTFVSTERIWIRGSVTVLAALAMAGPADAEITLIASVDDLGLTAIDFDSPSSVAIDSAGNIYVAASGSQNVLRVAPNGTVTEIIDAVGDGGVNGLGFASGVAVDAAGNVYVAGGSTQNVFKIAVPGTCSTAGTPCTITEIIDSTGDGGVNGLGVTGGIAVDGSGNVYVAGETTNNVSRIAAPGTCSTTGTPCSITEIIDANGDGVDALNTPDDIAVDASGSVFVAGRSTHNVFEIATPGTCSTSGTPCTIAEIIDDNGDGTEALNTPSGVAIDGSGNVYVSGEGTQNVFRITPSSTITEVMDATGDGGTNGLGFATAVAVDGSGNVYVSASSTNNVLRIATPGTCSTGGTPCTITEIIDASGDGGQNGFSVPVDLAIDALGDVYGVGATSDNLVRIAQPGSCSVTGTRCLILEILDGGPVTLYERVAVDGSGNVFFTANQSVYQLTPEGALTEIINGAGDGGPTGLGPLYLSGLAVDAAGNVYVGSVTTDNVFRIATPGTCSVDATPCSITEIIDANGDGVGKALNGASALAVDAAGNVYVAGVYTFNAFKISTPGTCSTTGVPCTITEIIDGTGDGASDLAYPLGIAADAAGNVYVTSAWTSGTGVFRIEAPGTCSTTGAPCTITQVISSAGDGVAPLDAPIGLSADAQGNVFVAGYGSSNAFKIQTPGSCSTSGPTCAITEIIEATDIDYPWVGSLATGPDGDVFVTGRGSANAVQIRSPGSCSTGGTPCAIAEIIDSTGDGTNALVAPSGIAVDASGNSYVIGQYPGNVFRISPPILVPAVPWRGGLLLALILVSLGIARLGTRRFAR